MDDFYTYKLAYPESMGGAVFYVGKGQGNRIDQHEKEAKRGHQCLKCNIIRSIWAYGEEVRKMKVDENLPEQSALQREKEMMRQYDFNVLANRIGLGEAKYATPEWSAKRSADAKAKWEQIKTSSWWLKRHKQEVK